MSRKIIYAIFTAALIGLWLAVTSPLACQPVTGGKETTGIYMSDEKPGGKIDPANLSTKKPEPLPVATIGDKPETARALPQQLPGVEDIILGSDGKAYAVMAEAGNKYVVPVGGAQLNRIIRDNCRRSGRLIRRHELQEVNQALSEYAEASGHQHAAWNRVAPVNGGIEIDLGDESHRRVRITAEGVDVLNAGSSTLFCRSAISSAIVAPADTGDLGRLKPYLNISDSDRVLLIGYLAYTLSTPKKPTSQFLHLCLVGDQGSGKSVLCRRIQAMVDPNRVGPQIMPSTAKDIAIALMNGHLACWDNVRSIEPKMADIMCCASTGGAMSSRQLYSDSGQAVINLHGAAMMNTIHNIVDQPDLAQRFMQIRLKRIDEAQRKTEAELDRAFQSDLPYIMRGLFEYISLILKNLPDAKVTSPERMLDYVRYLAAMEAVDGVPPGTYQAAYSYSLKESQRDSLTDNVLAAAVLEFAEENITERWSGTPAELLLQLNSFTSRKTQRSFEWPANPIALSKRLAPLQAGLLTQGIEVEFRRGKHRTITITYSGVN